MFNDNVVVFKGRKNSITILLDDKTDFNLLKEVFTKKVKDAHTFFNRGKSGLSFSGRKLSESEESQLIDILSNETSFNISFLKDEDYGEYVLENELTGVKNIDEALFNARENKTMFHTGTLRSGQSIKYNGSVVVIGDLNAGAEIIAEGNVIILGLAKGVIHAGSKGSKDCYVIALGLMLTQLRIADILTYIPDEMKKQNRADVRPLQAYVHEGQLYIAPI